MNPKKNLYGIPAWPLNRRPQRAASNPAKRDNSSLSSRNFVRVSFDFAQDHELVEWHLFEAAYRLVFVRPALARRHRNLSLFLRYFRALVFIVNLCMTGLPAIPARRPAGGWQAGLGQGHGKKRHPRAHSPGNFKGLKC